MPFDVAIIIVTYNSAGQINACLRSVLDQGSGVRQQIIVLDNASHDGTAELVRSGFPEVQIIEPGRNLGFACGVNEAVRHAQAEFVLLLNPDTEILDRAVEKVVAFARAHPHHGFYGGRTLKPDGSLEPSSCWGAPTLASMALFAFGLTTLAPRHPVLDPESLGRWPRDTVREVGVITGCFLLARRQAWQELGGFDERFFMYGEDVDLALRARKAGYRPVVCPDAQVMHEVGQSSARPIDKMMLLYRGKAHLVRTHWQGAGQWLGLFFLKLGVALRAALSGAVRLVRPSAAADRWTALWKRRKEWVGGYAGPAFAAALPQMSALPVAK